MWKKFIVKISGFTLPELVVVIAIIAILAAIAIPSYRNSVRKSRRAEAQEQLLNFAGMAERIFTQSNSYATATLPADTDYYTYTFPVAITATTYTIRATPTAIQSADGCGTMSLTQTGQRTHTGSEADCW
jgi:type IV pilus assembly protein PilE